MSENLRIDIEAELGTTSIGNNFNRLYGGIDSMGHLLLWSMGEAGFSVIKFKRIDTKQN